MKNRFAVKLISDRKASVFGRIIVLTGARQTGKTTLVKRIFPDMPYISVEDPVLVEQYRSLTSSQWKSNFPQAILDEVQKEPRLIESIKSVYDQYPETGYILLGSSQIMLMKKIRESLAGRANIFELYPLTLPEFMTNNWEDRLSFSYFQRTLSGEKENVLPLLLEPEHAEKINLFKDYLKFGGYPAISGKGIPDEEKYEWLNNYIKTYLERDIRDLADIRNLEPFSRTQKMMALYTGQLLNNSKIAADAGVSVKTVQRFIEYMRISYQLIILQPWSRNQKKRLIKSPKVHFMDVGILRAILRKRGDLDGHQFESAIVSEIYKQLQTAGINADIYHLRTMDGREVDVLIEQENGYTAIEIKQSKTVRSTDGIHLRGLEDILDKPVLHKFILSNDFNNKDFGDGIIAMPAVKFLS